MVPARRSDAVIIPSKGDEKSESTTKTGTNTHMVFGNVEKSTDKSMDKKTTTKNRFSAVLEISGSVSDIVHKETVPPIMQEKTAS